MIITLHRTPEHQTMCVRTDSSIHGRARTNSAVIGDTVHAQIEQNNARRRTRSSRNNECYWDDNYYNYNCKLWKHNLQTAAPEKD